MSLLFSIPRLIVERNPQLKRYLSKEEVHQRVGRDTHVTAVVAHFLFELRRHLHDDSRGDTAANGHTLLNAAFLGQAVGHADAGEDWVTCDLEIMSLKLV